MANVLMELHEEFTDLQKQLKQYGAYDSEPTRYFAYLMRRAISGEKWKDFSHNNWELFETVDGWEEAANKLTAKAKFIYHEVQRSQLLHVNEFKKYYGYND